MKKGFTLAEVLITLAIIGVVAAVSIPSVISNSNQQQYKTGLKKAVSVLNSAITMGMAKEGVSPYDLSKDYTLFDYLTKHMSVMKSTDDLSTYFYAKTPLMLGESHGKNNFITNKVFYTMDGMRFEFFSSSSSTGASNWQRTHEQGVLLNICYGYDSCNSGAGHSWGYNCGSYGLAKNNYDTDKTPCLITVDVNGDRKPNPSNVNCKKPDCATNYKTSDLYGTHLTDLFSIMITDKEAIPFGIAAQRAMYSGKPPKK